MIKSIQSDLAMFTKRKKQILSFVICAVMIVSSVVVAFSQIGNDVQAAPGDYTYDYSIGNRGAISYPYDIARSPDGTFYVADWDGLRVVHMAADGTLLGQLGDGTSGSGQNQFSTPSGVGVDSSGNVYVADTGNNRVVKYDSAGNFVMQFGSGSFGLGPGQLPRPNDVTVDSAGNVYVTCGGYFAGNYRYGVKKFDASGNEVGSWIRPYSAAPGDFNWPQGIAVHNGELYIADSNNNRVQVLSATDGSFVRSWGGAGTGSAATARPWGIDVDDTTGNVLVGESQNQRAHVFTSAGVNITTYGDTAPTALTSVAGVTYDGAGGSFVVDSSARLVRKYDSANNLVNSYSIQNLDPTALYDPRLLAQDSNGNLYVYNNNSENPGTDDDHRIITIFNPAGDYIGQRVIQTSYFNGETGENFSINPYYGMLILPNGDIYLTGFGSKSDGVTSKSYSVIKYAANSDQPEFILESNTTEYSLSLYTVQYDAQNDKFVGCGYAYNATDNRAYSFVSFDTDGSALHFFSPRNGATTPDGHALNTDVRSFAIDSNGQYVVIGFTYDQTEGQSYAVARYDPSTANTFTTLIRQSESVGNIDKYVSTSGSIALDAANNIYLYNYLEVYDNDLNINNTYAVGKFDPNGAVISYIAERGNEEDQVESGSDPGRLVVDRYGNVYVLDTNSSALVKKYSIEADIPSPPLDVAADATGENTIDVVWTAPQNDGGAPITGYKIAYRAVGSASWQFVTVDGSTFSRTLTSLHADTEYEIQVFAINAAGESVASQTVTARTFAKGTTPIIPLPPNTGQIRAR